MKDRKVVGHWSTVEHHRFLEGINIHSKNWVKVSKHVQTRTATQVRTHYQKYSQKADNALNNAQRDMNIDKTTQYGEGMIFE